MHGSAVRAENIILDWMDGNGPRVCAICALRALHPLNLEIRRRAFDRLSGLEALDPHLLQDPDAIGFLNGPDLKTPGKHPFFVVAVGPQESSGRFIDPEDDAAVLRLTPGGRKQAQFPAFPRQDDVLP